MTTLRDAAVRLATELRSEDPLYRMLSAVLRRHAGHGLAGPQLDELVQDEAKARGLPNWRAAEATPELQRAAVLFVRSVSKALSVWAQERPAEYGADVKDVLGDEGALVVYRTLEGRGQGILQGRWVLYWPEKRELVAYLARALSSSYGDFKDALVQAAQETGS